MRLQGLLQPLLELLIGLTFLAVCVGIPLTGWISDLLSPHYGARSLGIAAFTTISAAAIVGLVSHSGFLVRVRRADERPVLC